MGSMRVLNATLLALLIVILLGCAGGSGIPVRGSAPGAKVLPPIPATRGASELTETLLNGIEVYLKSAGATEQGTALSLGSAPGGYEWAMYRFNPGTQALDSLSALLNVPLGSSVWIALSDYAVGRWRISGPYSKGKTLALDDGQYTSPAGDMYVAVVVSGGSSAMVEALSVRTIRPANQPPTADLQADVVSGNAPLTVHFDASLSGDPDGVIKYYLWDFDGDGGYERTTFTPTTAYTYTAPGLFDAAVAAVDDCGVYGTDSVQINVNVLGNTAPTADLNADKTASYAPYTIHFDASGSSDSDGNIVKYEWDFDGDGSYEEYGASPTTAYTYPVYGWYVAKLRVTDDDGAQDTATLNITLPSEWWMFGMDPTHNRRSPYVGAQTNHVKWSYPTGGGVDSGVYSSPAIGADGTVYVGSISGNLYAIKPDGTLKWKYVTGGYVESSPAIGADGTVYGGSSDHNLYAINPDGSFRWSYTAGNCVRSSPAIGAGGMIYAGSWDKKVYAFNPGGSMSWSYTTGGQAESSPAIGPDRSLYEGNKDGKLYAINPDGSFRWSYTTGDMVESSPAIGADGTVYVGSDDDKLYAIKPDGTLKWAYTTLAAVYSSPAIGADGTVYVGSNDYNLYAIKPDGTLKWSYPTGSYVGSSPALGADGTVYVGSSDWNVYAITPDGTLKWKYLTGGQVYSGPAIGADGTVYVGSDDGNLYAFADL